MGKHGMAIALFVVGPLLWCAAAQAQCDGGRCMEAVPIDKVDTEILIDQGGDRVTLDATLRTLGEKQGTDQRTGGSVRTLAPTGRSVSTSRSTARGRATPDALDVRLHEVLDLCATASRQGFIQVWNRYQDPEDGGWVTSQLFPLVDKSTPGDKVIAHPVMAGKQFCMVDSGARLEVKGRAQNGEVIIYWGSRIDEMLPANTYARAVRSFSGRGRQATGDYASKVLYYTAR